MPPLGKLAVALALCAALVAPARADGVDIDRREIRVTAGKSLDMQLPGPAQVFCDDTRVVRVAYVGSVLRVTGVGPGHTLCGVYSVIRGQFRWVFDVLVSPGS
jgi:hypothetical protein